MGKVGEIIIKKLILAFIFILSFSLFAFAQKGKKVCGLIIFNRSHAEILPETRENLMFTVILKPERQNLEYEWNIEPKIKFSGQGTSSVSIKTPIPTNLVGFTIIATVKIKGLPDDCVNEFSGFSKTSPKNEFPKNEIYKYSRMTIFEIREIIDDLIIELWKRPDDKGYILFEVENDKQLQSVKRRISSIIKHIASQGYDPQNFLIEVCKSNKKATTISFASAKMGIMKSENCEKMDIEPK